MHINSVIHDNARANSINTKHSYSPISEPHTIDLKEWQSVADISRKASTSLKRERVVLPTSSIRGPHYKSKERTILAITNATHTRHARQGRAPIIS